MEIPLSEALVSEAQLRNQVATRGAVAIGEDFARQLIDPVDVCMALLAHARSDAARHVMITVTAMRATQQAAASSARHRTGRPRSPLDGVPIVVKDMFDMAGITTTAGSATRRDYPPAAVDAVVVHLLDAAGMVLLGKTNLSEFALGVLGINPTFGTPLNPHSPAAARTPGGSSAGSAVAVAAGIAPVAIGTDTSGSVRIPAALCGVIGYKASSGRYDTTGMQPLSATLDSIGMFARLLPDILALDAALRATVTGSVPDHHRNVRIVVPRGELLDDCTPGIAAAFDNALQVFAVAGARIETREVPALQQAQRQLDAHGALVVADAYQLHHELLSRAAKDVDPAVLRRLRTHHTVDADSLRRALPALRKDLQEQLDGAILAFPTVRQTAPLLAPLLADDALLDATNQRLLRSTMLTSYLGMPGLALPIGTAEDGLPASALLSAPAGHDAQLLATGTAVWSPHDWDA